MVDSHPSLVMTLVVGLLVAFALQLLLANLGLATGITLVGSLSSVDPDEGNDQQPEEGHSKHKIGLILGFATLASVNLALFTACFLAVKLSLVTQALTGAVLGVVIWSAYLLLLVWLGSSTIGFLLGSVGEVIGFGWQGLRTITQLILGRKPEAIESRLQQQITTELAMIRETQQALNTANLETLQTLLQPALTSRQSAPSLPPDLNTDILNFLKSAHTHELTLEEIDRRLQHLELHNNSDSSHSWTSDLKPLLQVIRSRIDLSELDVERVIESIRSFPNRVGETVEKISSFILPTTTIQDDVEDFLLNVDLSKLSRKTIKSEFIAVIYDVEADPYLVQQQLSQLTSDRLTEILQQREDLSAKKIAKVVDRLEAAQQEILETVNRTITQARFQQANQPLADYLRTTTLTELKPKRIQKQLRQHLEQSKTAFNEWTEQLQSLEREFFSQPLMERKDIDQTTIEQLLEQLEVSRDRLIAEVQDLQTQVNAQAVTLWQSWLEYLSSSSEKLNTRNLKRQLKQLLKAAQVSFNLLKVYLPDYDRDLIEQRLTERGDLTAKQVQQVCDRIDQIWQSLFEPVEQPPITSMAGQVTQALINYLNQTLQQSELSTLDVSTVQQDLLKLLKSLSLPVGISSLLTTVDWQQVIKYLIEQNSLPTTEATALSNMLQQAVYTISKPPRRWAVRAQAAIQDTTVNSMLKLGSELPEAIIQPVVQQFDETRSQLVQQVEHLQQQTQQRVETLKFQAQQQIETARKTAAIAAWWLFSTALTSLITSAIAGFLAVTQLPLTLVD